MIKTYIVYEKELVTNIILVGDDYPITDNMVDVTDMSPTPQIGWSYKDGEFTPPPLVIEEPQPESSEPTP